MITERQRRIAERIPRCGTLADVGCDHGCVAKYALDKGVCDRAVLTDISEKSLDKARRLLASYGERASFYVADGLSGVSEKADVAVIAGMGGREIIGIVLKNPVDRLVLQPMKNVDTVRAELVKSGYKITYDEVFSDKGKYYDLLCLERGADELDFDGLTFGRTNLARRGEAFLKRLSEEIEKRKKFLLGITDERLRAETIRFITRGEEILNEDSRGC